MCVIIVKMSLLTNLTIIIKCETLNYTMLLYHAPLIAILFALYINSYTTKCKCNVVLKIIDFNSNSSFIIIIINKIYSTKYSI